MSQKTIGRYKIVDELGRGGMATVYRAYDPMLEREVALKLLPNYFAHDPEFSARFEREAKTVASLEHGAIVSMYDYGEDGEWPYFVMRLMTGGSLKDRIAQGPMDPAAAVHIVHRIASALDKAHSRGIIHRDLKPGNVMFDDDGEAYLGDFGIVKLAEGSESYTRTGNTLGTPAYMSPEQADGRPDLDGRSDTYSLGIILYEMLTGTAPFVHESMARLLVMHLTSPIPNLLEARPDAPPALQAVIEKAMAKERDDRFGSAMEMAEAAEKALHGAGEAVVARAQPAVEATAAKATPAPAEAKPAVESASAQPVVETAPKREARPKPAEAAAAQAQPVVKAQPAAVPMQAADVPTAKPELERPTVGKEAAGKGGGIPKWVFAAAGGVVVLIILFVVLSGGGGEDEPAAAGGLIGAIQERGLAVVGVSDLGPPFDYEDDDGALVGFDVDLAEEVVDRIFDGSVDVVFVKLFDEERWPALAAGDVDMVLGAAHFTSREDLGLWTSNYFLDGVMLTVWSDSGISDVAELDGAAVCTEADTFEEEKLFEYLDDTGLSMEIVESDDFDVAEDGFSEGRCDALLDYWSYASSLDAEGDFAVVGDLVTREPIAILVASDQAQWYEQVALALEEIIDDGTWDSLYDDWFAESPPWSVEEMLAEPPADQ